MCHYKVLPKHYMCRDFSCLMRENHTISVTRLTKRYNDIMCNLKLYSVALFCGAASDRYIYTGEFRLKLRVLVSLQNTVRCTGSELVQNVRRWQLEASATKL